MDPGALFKYEGEISQVDQKPPGLPQDEDRVLFEDGVNEKKASTADTEIPERDGDNASALFFGGNPLDQEPAEKQSLAEEAQDQQGMGG